MNILDIGKSLNEFMPIYAEIEEKDVRISCFIPFQPIKWPDWMSILFEILSYTYGSIHWMGPSSIPNVRIGRKFSIFLFLTIKLFCCIDEHMHEVTILIGIAWKGTPIAGVINQPFYSSDIEDLVGDRYTWGLCGLGWLQFWVCLIQKNSTGKYWNLKITGLKFKIKNWEMYNNFIVSQGLFSLLLCYTFNEYLSLSRAWQSKFHSSFLTGFQSKIPVEFQNEYKKQHSFQIQLKNDCFLNVFLKINFFSLKFYVILTLIL